MKPGYRNPQIFNSIDLAEHLQKYDADTIAMAMASRFELSIVDEVKLEELIEQLTHGRK